MTPNAKHWFGAETLIASRIDSEAAPRLVERRVVLFLAENMEDATTLAETEGREYAKEIAWPNSAGQMVTKEYLACNVFEIRTSPDDRVEVFSTIALVLEPLEANDLIDRFWGETDDDVQARFEPDFERFAAQKEKK